MTVRYVGAIKEYLCLPLFALFGPGAVVIRVVSALLGALGIWGIARLLAEHVSLPAAAGVTAVLALNPSYVDLTVFDNGTVSIWMGALGVLCMALARYLRLQTAAAAFWLGASMGLGVWARANFLWMLLAMFAAAVVVLGRRIFAPLSHWAALISGGIVGGAPFLLYQVISRGGTWQALDMFHADQPLAERLLVRLVMFGETLLSDREHRAMWNGPSTPAWQLWLFPSVVLAACVVCLAARCRPVWARAAAICFLVLGAFLFFSKMIVSEHHLIVLVPPAALVTVLACCIVARHPAGRAIAGALAAVYLGSAISSQVAAIGGLAKSGGIGQWSDGVYALSDYLQRHYPDREIKILDWGLENNLYVLSDGEIRGREIYGDVTSASDPRWTGEIRRGGVFLMNGPANRQFPAASQGFLEALAAARPVVRRFTVPQREGVPYAVILDVEPNTVQDFAPAAAGGDDIGSRLLTGQPRFAKQLEGFNQIEPGGWRWSTRQFSVTLRAPAGSAGARLTLDLFVAGSSIQKLGPMTLSASVGNRKIGSETYTAEGKYTFARDLEPGWLKPGPNRIEFSLDKYVRPSIDDGRELGVVVTSASLEPR
jgi:hypothetical protein